MTEAQEVPCKGKNCGRTDGEHSFECKEEASADFGAALRALKQGQRVARAGWNGKGMWLALQAGSVITKEQARGGAAKARADEGAENITIAPHIDMRAADGTIVIGWLASQTDMLAEDWAIVE